MSKPDWKDAPEWAEWLAQSEDGAWFFYEKKPSRRKILGEFVGDGLRQYVLFSATGRKTAPEWQKTLERRPLAGKECK